MSRHNDIANMINSLSLNQRIIEQKIDAIYDKLIDYINFVLSKVNSKIVNVDPFTLNYENKCEYITISKFNYKLKKNANDKYTLYYKWLNSNSTTIITDFYLIIDTLDDIIYYANKESVSLSSTLSDIYILINNKCEQYITEENKQ